MSVWYEPGRYRVEVTSAALGESEASKSPQIEVGIRILGIYTEEGRLLPVTGSPRTVFLTLTEATLGSPSQPGWVAQTLQDLGFVGPTFADLGPLVGKQRDAQCNHDDFSGEAREKWSIWRETRAPKNPAQQQTVRALNAKHGALLKMFASAAPRPNGTPAAAPPVNGQANGRQPAPQPGRPGPMSQPLPRPTPATRPAPAQADEYEPAPPPAASDPIPF